MINEKFRLLPSDIESFKKQGFLLLKSFFSSETIAQMTALTTSQLKPPSNNYGAGFSKLKYDVGNDDTYLLSLMQDELFSSTMKQLCGETVFFTQGLGFELARNESKGFPWHVGTQSFGFQRMHDSGFTIWTPLCHIDPEKQRGGMAYVPKDKISGEFVYQHINLLPDFIQSKIASGEKYDFESFSRLKNQLLNAPEMDLLLNHYAVEDEFELGDALIFDKHVMHRSIALEDGPLETRMAFALRFSGISARYDKKRVNSLQFPRQAFQYDVGSGFNDQVCISDGESVYDSSFFDGSRKKRTVVSARSLEEAPA